MNKALETSYQSIFPLATQQFLWVITEPVWTGQGFSIEGTRRCEVVSLLSSRPDRAFSKRESEGGKQYARSALTPTLTLIWDKKKKKEKGENLKPWVVLCVLQCCWTKVSLICSWNYGRFESLVNSARLLLGF